MAEQEPYADKPTQTHADYDEYGSDPRQDKPEKDGQQPDEALTDPA